MGVIILFQLLKYIFSGYHTCKNWIFSLVKKKLVLPCHAVAFKPSTSLNALLTFNKYPILTNYNILGVSGPLLCMADMSPFWFLGYHFHCIKCVEKQSLQANTTFLIL
jgi:hypothetical protein